MKIALLSFALASMFALAGCSTTLSKLGGVITPTTVEISQIAIDAAVGAVAGPNMVVGKAKALVIKTVASQLLALDSGSSIPIAALQAALAAKISTLNLSPSDALAANELVLVVNQTVTNLLTKPANSTSTTPSTAATAQVVIATVLQQVINACGAYGV